MNEATRERMHNRVFLSSLPGLDVVYTIKVPALKRWATAGGQRRPPSPGLTSE
jgi:hypothetical protein